MAELISREVSMIIDRELRDERIGMVTVTGVDMSRDLKHAHVFVSVLGSEEETEVSIAALNDAASFIRTCLRDRVALRYLPVLRFFHDSSMIDGMRMDRILETIRSNEENENE